MGSPGLLGAARWSRPKPRPTLVGSYKPLLPLIPRWLALVALQRADQPPARLVEGGGHERRVHGHAQVERTHAEGVVHVLSLALGSSATLAGDAQGLQIGHVDGPSIVAALIPASGPHVAAAVAVVVLLVVVSASHLPAHVVVAATSAPVATVRATAVQLALGGGLRNVHRDALDDVIFATEAHGDLRVEERYECECAERLRDEHVRHFTELGEILTQVILLEVLGAAADKYFARHLHHLAILKNTTFLVTQSSVQAGGMLPWLKGSAQFLENHKIGKDKFCLEVTGLD